MSLFVCVARRLLCGVCCLLHSVVRFVVWCLLFLACCVVVVAWCLMFVVCCCYLLL